jgi:hypothetical protein
MKKLVSASDDPSIDPMHDSFFHPIANKRQRQLQTSKTRGSGSNPSELLIPINKTMPEWSRFMLCRDFLPLDNDVLAIIFMFRDLRMARAAKCLALGALNLLSQFLLSASRLQPFLVQ